MSEVSRSYHHSHFTRALLGAGLLLGGCTPSVNALPEGSGLPRCYNKPLAPAVSTLLDRYPDAYAEGEVITVYKTKEGKIAQDPGPLPKAMREKIAGGVVRISREVTDKKRMLGSGTIVANKKQERVILTAAHVVSDAPLDKLKVTDAKGHTSVVTGGCIIYETKGKLEDVSTVDDPAVMPANLDVAVLKLDSPKLIGSSTLKIAGTTLPRGSWDATIASYQHYSTQPIIYNALSVGQLSGSRGQYVTGMATGQDCRPKSSSGLSYCAAQPGVSGAGIFNRETGEIMGISDAIPTIPNGEKQPAYSPNDLTRLMNIRQTGDTEHTWPMPIQGPLNTVLQLALVAPAAN